MSGTRLYLLGFALLSLTIVRADMPSQLRGMLSSTDDSSRKFWGMSKSHPIRMELERDPGVLLGTEGNFDLSKLRSGNIEKAATSIKSGNMPFGMSAVFGRNMRSGEETQCQIHIQVTETHPGHCIRLRNNTPACQNDKYVAVNYNECS